MLTIPNHRLLTFGFIAFILIGLEQGLLGLFMADMGTLLARSPEDLGLFFALHGLGSAVVTGSALVASLERVNSKRIAMASLALSLGSALIVMGDAWILKLIAAPLLGAGFGGLSILADNAAGRVWVSGGCWHRVWCPFGYGYIGSRAYPFL